MTPFETDSEGNITTKPITGWAITDVAGTAVLLQLQFVESEEELQGGKSRSFQFVLTAPKALELAEVLTKRAKRLLEAKLPPGKSPH